MSAKRDIQTPEKAVITSERPTWFGLQARARDPATGFRILLEPNGKSIDRAVCLAASTDSDALEVLLAHWGSNGALRRLVEGAIWTCYRGVSSECTGIFDGSLTCALLEWIRRRRADYDEKRWPDLEEWVFADTSGLREAILASGRDFWEIFGVYDKYADSGPHGFQMTSIAMPQDLAPLSSNLYVLVRTDTTTVSEVKAAWAKDHETLWGLLPAGFQKRLKASFENASELQLNSSLLSELPSLQDSEAYGWSLLEFAKSKILTAVNAPKEMSTPLAASCNEKKCNK